MSTSSEHIFWLRGGKSIKNLEELAHALAAMDNETFQHHVTMYKNDFANWIKDVVKDETLAQQVGKVNEKDKMKEHVLTALAAKDAHDHIMRIASISQPTPNKKPKIHVPIPVKSSVLKRQKIVSSNVTHLVLSHVFAHETSKHHSLVTLASYLVLGIVSGVALTMLLIGV